MNSRGSTSLFLCRYHVITELFIQKISLSPFNACDNLIKYQLNINAKTNSWTHFPFIHLYAYPYAVLIICVVRFEIMKCESPNSVQDFFSGYSGCFEFPYEFKGQHFGVKQKKSAENWLCSMILGLNELSYVKKILKLNYQ